MPASISRTSSYDALLAEAASFAQAHAAHGELLAVASTRTAVDDFVRFHCGNSAGIHRLTLSQLTAQFTVEAMAERGLAPLNGFGAEALAARAIFHARNDGRLAYFAPVATAPGFARALARTLRELRLANASFEEVAAAGAPGADIAQLHAIYEELLTEGRLADFPAMLGLAATVIQQGLHRFLRLPVLLLDVDASAARVNALVAALLQQAPASLTVELATEASTEPAASSLDQLRNFLFAPQDPHVRLRDDSFALFSAAGEGLECTEIARRIHRLAESGVPFDSIAILLRDPTRYQPLLEEALHRAVVPFYFTRGAVRPDPAGRAFLALLACANEKLPATRFAEYLSLGQTPRPGEAIAAGQSFLTEDDLLWNAAADMEASVPAIAAEPARVEAPAAWEQLIVDACVVEGPDRWARRLRGLENEFQLRLSRMPEDERRRQQIEEQLRQLGNLEQIALPLIDRLAALPKTASWREWLSTLSDLAQSTLINPDSVHKVLNELWSMGEIGPVSLEEVLQVLADRLRFLRRLPPKRRYGQVWVGSIEEARACSFHTVFLPGLAEGVFPKRALEDPLLLDVHRRTLTAGVPLRDDRVAEERHRLRIATAAAARQFVVSYPRMDAAQNRPRVPSFYAMELVRAAEGCVPDLKTFEQRAAAGAMTRLGWPAPIDAQQAVDPLEFDLSILQEANQRPKGEARGVARYLFEINPHLGRAMRTRYERWSKKWRPADGLICRDEESKAVLARHRLQNRAWSASTLQQFAACPYKFALHGIHYLRLREEPVPIQEMDPLTRGALFHEVVFELFQRADTPADFPRLADTVLDDVAARYQDQLVPAIPRVWRGEVEDLRADLRGWLRRIEKDTEGWEPIHCELAFGLDSNEGRDDHSTPNPIPILDNILVRGSVDWIERHKESGVLRITDHKTGRAPKQSIGHVSGGAILQPLLYAAAMEKHFERPVKLSRLYYCTQRGGYSTQEVPVQPEAFHNLKQALHLVDEAIEEGVLPAAPREGECRWCDFAAVCGPREEERTARKPEIPQLATLRTIR
ncbi:MAG: exodeoxyribonuclease V subunit gamma [Acidobacteria bacterium]|nr:exodeoxyribonuclease V subunit gamma [Acidobacteriota bacterium]